MLHITSNVEDVNSRVLDWMTENTHYKAPTSELLHAIPVTPPVEGARRIYDEPELSYHLMQVLMKPLEPGQAPRTTFPVKDLLNVPRIVYHILTKTLSTILGHNSEEQDVVGIMMKAQLLPKVVLVINHNICIIGLMSLFKYISEKFKDGLAIGL